MDKVQFCPICKKRNAHPVIQQILVLLTAVIQLFGGDWFRKIYERMLKLWT